MMRVLAVVSYWLAAVTITLGAYGHGFLGVKPVRLALATTTLPPAVLRVLWIVWYSVSGSMVIFGALLFWAWPALQAGSTSRAAVPIIIGAYYVVLGLVCYAYSGRDPFWLLFFVQGSLLLGATRLLIGGVAR